MSKNIYLLGMLIAMTGCATIPAGPSVAVMPGPGKPFDLFVSEETFCRNFAERQSGGTPRDAQTNDTVSGAAIGTALGAAAGTAVGAAAGNTGAGAVAGAGLGLMEGTAIGASSGYYAGWSLQDRYDVAYEQCMYAKGNQVPGFPTAYAPPLPPLR